jgi:hypothetical protein
MSDSDFVSPKKPAGGAKPMASKRRNLSKADRELERVLELSRQEYEQHCMPRLARLCHSARVVFIHA